MNRRGRGPQCTRFIPATLILLASIILIGQAVPPASAGIEPLAEGGFATYSGDGRYVAVVGGRAIDVFDAAGYDLATRIPASRVTTQFGVPSFSDDGRFLAAPVAQDEVKIWNVSTGAEVLTIQAKLDPYRRVSFSPSGDLLALHTGDDIELRSTVTGELVRVLEGDGGSVIAVAFRPDGALLASGNDDHTIRLWDVGTGEVIHRLVGHQREVSSLAFDPSGNFLASGSGDTTARIWDLTTSEVIILDAHTEPVTWVSFNSDGHVLVTSSHDDTVRVWDRSTGRNTASLDAWEVLGNLGQEGPPETRASAKVYSAAFSPNGSCVAISYCYMHRCRVGLWNLEVAP